MPKVSVVMSVYNESFELIKNAIDSILNQTFKELEYIIIIDNPERTDLIQSIKRMALTDSRIKIVINEENIGLPLSLNKGIELSTTPYIVRMDADDISLPQRISKQYNVMVNNDYDVVSTSYYIMDENGKTTGYNDTVDYGNPIEEVLPFKNIIHHPTTIIKKDMLEKVGGYRNVKSAEDYDLWLRMILDGAKFYKLKDKLFKYRIRESGISQSNKGFQIASFIYIKKLFLERLKTGKDSFSEENQSKFIKKLLKNNDLKVAESYARLESLRSKDTKIERNFIKMKILLTNNVYRQLFLQNSKNYVYLKILKG